jgi:hypothetical protein
MMWRRRLLLILLIACAAVPPFFHYQLVDKSLYNTPHVGGLHSMEIWWLLEFGRSTIYLPLLFLAGLVASAVRPTSTSTVLVISTSIFILSLLFHLMLAFAVISLHI